VAQKPNARAKKPKIQICRVEFVDGEYRLIDEKTGEVVEPGPTPPPRRPRLHEMMSTLASDFPNVPSRLIESMAIGEIVEDALGVSDVDAILELAADAEAQIAHREVRRVVGSKGGKA
jgi:hypothetical protein